jgi:hypothetical protein
MRDLTAPFNSFPFLRLFFFVFLCPALLQSHRNAFHVLDFSHPFSEGEQARMFEEIF